MKQILSLLVVLGIIGVYVYFIMAPKKYEDWNGYKVQDFQIEGKKYKLAIADTETKWQQGLMNVQKPQPIDGMVFLFPQKEYRAFWNENTHLDLQLFWYKGDELIEKTYLPSIEKSGTVFTVKSKDVVDRVVEFIQ